MPRYTAESVQQSGEPLRVFLDGVEVHDVYMADTDEGVIEQYVRAGEGFRRYELTPDGRNAVRRERRGIVTVVPYVVG